MIVPRPICVRHCPRGTDRLDTSPRWHVAQQPPAGHRASCTPATIVRTDENEPQSRPMSTGRQRRQRPTSSFISSSCPLPQSLQPTAFLPSPRFHDVIVAGRLPLVSSSSRLWYYSPVSHVQIYTSASDAHISTASVSCARRMRAPAAAAEAGDFPLGLASWATGAGR